MSRLDNVMLLISESSKSRLPELKLCRSPSQGSSGQARQCDASISALVKRLKAQTVKMKSYSGHRDAIQQLLPRLKSEPGLLLAVRLRQARSGQRPVTVGAEY